ncbi:MAG TPA: ABC transporter [Micromonosporaceae bacterium]|nr:ABC transporter [Micromonosporaceae bacterium]
MQGEQINDPHASTSGAGVNPPQPPLRGALIRLRAVLASARYPLALPSAEEANRISAALVEQLDDYLLPRLAQLDAPLLVAVGGSTGVGKSTLVNSLIRARVSASGVLRPTTRAPVLVCHPRDLTWFRSGPLLPGLTRTSRPGKSPDTLHLVSAPAIPPGLAFLDAPDIDSIVDANRALAAQLLAAADLWLFVTTPARYADAVPWELLHTARLRGTALALVLDRVPDPARDEVAAHLSEMLTAQGFGDAPLFVVPETTINGQGLLPENVTAPLRAWFGRIASDPQIRARIIQQTVNGALAALAPTVAGLTAAADEQAVAGQVLNERVRAAYRAAHKTVTEGLRNGGLLQGELLVRWQEFVRNGELLRTLQLSLGRLRDRVSTAASGERRIPGRQLKAAIKSQLITLLCGAAAEAAEAAYAGWRANPYGLPLLQPALARPSADFPDRAERLVRNWRRSVLNLVRAEAGGQRSARETANAVNASGLIVMIAVVAARAVAPDASAAAGTGITSRGARDALAAVFGDPALQSLARKAQADLENRIEALMGEEAARYLARLAAADTEAAEGGARLGYELRRAAAKVEQAHIEAARTGDPGLTASGADG